MARRLLLFCVLAGVQSAACFVVPSLQCMPRHGCRGALHAARLHRTSERPSSCAPRSLHWRCSDASAPGDHPAATVRTPLRFGVGDRVIANTGFGHAVGVISQIWYRDPDWPADKVAPYQIQLADGTLVFAPIDSDDLVRPEGAEPWRKPPVEVDTASVYPPIAMHADIFDPALVDDWFVPELRAALAEWQRTGNVSSIAMTAIPGLRLEAPGVVSFECLQPDFCDKLLEEARHYSDCGLPQRAPNSMNKYGVVLNHIGMRPCFDIVLQRYAAALGALFFGDDDARPTYIGDELAHLEDWGGGSLSDHHTFIVRYRPDQDRHLDMHIDVCDVTFNVGLCDADDYSGSDLAFCGMFDSPRYRKHVHTYSHVKGRCVLHSGKRRHGALNVVKGERASLIMWTKSSQFRESEAYERRWGPAAVLQPEEAGSADRICLSYTHDADFYVMRRELGDTEGVRPAGEDLW